MNIKAPLNVHDFKTKPPFDLPSTPYDRITKYSFCGGGGGKMRALPCVRAFQKSHDGN